MDAYHTATVTVDAMREASIEVRRYQNILAAEHLLDTVSGPLAAQKALAGKALMQRFEAFLDAQDASGLTAEALLHEVEREQQALMAPNHLKKSA